MSTPERFSLKPCAAGELLKLDGKSWPVLLTLAYPTVGMSVPFPLRGFEKGNMRHEKERVNGYVE